MSESLYCRTCANLKRVDQQQYGFAVTFLSRAVTFVASLILVGILPWLSGKDPALALLRARSGEQEATPETLEAIRQSLGLDQGPFALLGRWFAGLLRGDAGNSWISGRPVLPGMLDATGVSLTLMGCAAAVAFTLALALCASTFYRGLKGRPRQPGGVMAALFTALPEFLLSSCLLIMGAVWLKWFPPYGWQGTQYAILPALALGIPAGGYLGRILSDALAATFREQWILTWCVAGVSRRNIALAVTIRAVAGVLPLIGLVLVSLTGGAIAVEKVFAIPGLGRAILGASAAQDLPALQTGIVIILLLAMLVGILATLLRALIIGQALRHGAMPMPDINRQYTGRDSKLSVAVCLLLIAVVLVAGAGRDPYVSQFARLQPPSLSLPFGADGMGRDLLARVAHGTMDTCITALLVAVACLAIGLIAGLFSRLFTGPTEIANALPPVVAGLLVAAIMGPGEAGASIAVTAVSWAPLAAHTAALVAETHARPYIRMLPILGVGPVRRSLFYTLPAIAGPLFRHAMLRVPGIALSLSALGFLGLGASPPLPEWGRLLAEGLPYTERAYWVVLAPVSALIVLSVLAVSASSIPGAKSQGNSGGV